MSLTNGVQIMVTSSEQKFVLRVVPILIRALDFMQVPKQIHPSDTIRNPSNKEPKTGVSLSAVYTATEWVYTRGRQIFLSRVTLSIFNLCYLKLVTIFIKIISFQRGGEKENLKIPPSPILL